MSGPEGRIPNKKSPIRTSATLAKILKTEGWTDHLANEVERYIFGCVTTERQRRQAERVEAAFKREIVPRLSEGDRMVLGRFLSLKMAVGFDAGLRTGLGARIHQSEDPVTPDEIYDMLAGSVTGPAVARALAKYHEAVFGGELSEDRREASFGRDTPAPGPEEGTE